MKTLTKAEEQVMQVLWKIEEGFLKDVVDAMPDPKPAYNTVATIIRILVDKGFIQFKTYGKSNLYQPAVSKEDYSSFEVQGVIKKYFNNSPSRLLSFLVKEKDIDLKELDEIMKEFKNKKS